LATKRNQFLLVDLTSGKIAQEVRWPTWLVSCLAIDVEGKRALACTDLAGTVTLLSLPELKPLREIRLSAELSGPILLAPSIAHAWPLEQIADKEENLAAELEVPAPRAGPALLVTDKAGFLYILPLGKTE
jgi:hypothetical protein